MRLLIIHDDPEGFCGAVAGELAMPSMICGVSECVCTRAHLGMASHAFSSAVEVAEREFTKHDLVLAAASCLQESGLWSADAARILGHRVADVMAEVAARYPVGLVLRPRYDPAKDCWWYHYELPVRE